MAVGVTIPPRAPLSQQMPRAPLSQQVLWRTARPDEVLNAMSPLTLPIARASRLLHRCRTERNAQTPTTRRAASPTLVDTTPRGPRPHHAVVRWLEYYGLAEGRAQRA